MHGQLREICLFIRFIVNFMHRSRTVPADQFINVSLCGISDAQHFVLVDIIFASNVYHPIDLPVEIAMSASPALLASWR